MDIYCVGCGASDRALICETLCTECMRNISDHKNKVRELRKKGRKIVLKPMMRGCAKCGRGYKLQELGEICGDCQSKFWE